jgi:hypothetical protein
VAWFQGGRARMLKFLIVDLGRDRIILGYPWFREFNPDIDWPMKFIKGPPFLTADATIEPNDLVTHTRSLPKEDTSTLTDTPSFDTCPANMRTTTRYRAKTRTTCSSPHMSHKNTDPHRYLQVQRNASKMNSTG